MNWKEWIGILATCMVFISFISNDLRKVRILNMIGSIIFVVYGVLIHSVSVSLLNTMCLFLHVYKLAKKGNSNDK